MQLHGTLACSPGQVELKEGREIPEEKNLFMMGMKQKLWLAKVETIFKE